MLSTAIGKTGVSREAILPSGLPGFLLRTPNTAWDREHQGSDTGYCGCFYYMRQWTSRQWQTGYCVVLLLHETVIGKAVTDWLLLQLTDRTKLTTFGQAVYTIVQIIRTIRLGKNSQILTNFITDRNVWNNCGLHRPCLSRSPAKGRFPVNSGRELG